MVFSLHGLAKDRWEEISTGAIEPVEEKFIGVLGNDPSFSAKG